MSKSATAFSGVFIIGTGLLGTSLGLCLRGNGVPVWLSDLSSSAAALAADYGAGEVATPHPDEVEVVVVATPPDVTASTVAQALTEFPQALVIDVASVKRSVRDDLEGLGADLSRYVGTHPMAGREKGGPTAARADLFVARPWVVCAGDTVSAQSISAVHGLVELCGATIHDMSAEDHDRIVAMVSHVPQVVSSVMAGALNGGDSKDLDLAGQGLRDVTRIAGSDPGLWIQILHHNAAPVSALLADVAAQLNAAAVALSDTSVSGAKRELAELLDAGVRGVSKIPGKHGLSKQFATLNVIIDDKPGQLAAVLTDVGEIGVNLEDMRLEHSPGAAVGFVELSIQPERVHELADALEARGWRIAGERA